MIKREFFAGRDCLVLLFEEYKNNYENSMLEENDITGLIKPEHWHINGCHKYCYNISGKGSLNKYAENYKIDLKQLEVVFESLSQIIAAMQEFFLNPECILLDADYIFLEDETVKFVYVPYSEIPPGMLDKFGKWILNNVNYEDKLAVELSYKIFDAITVGGMDIIGVIENVQRYLCENSAIRHSDNCIEDERNPKVEVYKPSKNGIVDKSIKKPSKYNYNRMFSSVLIIMTFLILIVVLFSMN